MNNKDFTKNFIKPLFTNMGTGITDVRYLEIPRHGEYLIVSFNDIHLQVNVTGDSYAAMVEDMYRQKAVYSTSHCVRATDEMLELLDKEV